MGLALVDPSARLRMTRRVRRKRQRARIGLVRMDPSATLRMTVERVTVESAGALAAIGEWVLRFAQDDGWGPMLLFYAHRAVVWFSK